MKELKDMTLEELTDYWTGYLIIAIGKNNFRSTVALCLSATMGNSFKQGRERERAEAKK